VKNLKDFFYPGSLEEALELLSKNEGSPLLNVPVAGSTGIFYSKNPKIRGLIDINRIGLDYIKKESHALKIGAATPVQKIAQSPAIKSLAGGFFAKAAGSIGSRLIRNTCTIGGNIVDLRIWSNLPAPLLVLEGKIKAETKKSSRFIPAEEFFSRRPSKILSPVELVTEIIIHLPPENARGAFIKFGRTKVDYTLMDTAAYMEIDGDRLKNVRIAVSAVTVLPQRLKSLEKFVEGKIFSEVFLEEIY